MAKGQLFGGTGSRERFAVLSGVSIYTYYSMQPGWEEKGAGP